MSFFDTHLLNLVVFVPLAFGVLVMLLPSAEHGQIRAAAWAGMVVDLVLGVVAYLRYDPAGPEYQLEYRTRWISDFGISFHTGADGLAISLILLTVILGPLLVMASQSSINTRVKEFHLALLVLQTAMLGALSSMDIVLFYVFWEAMLIPMYLLVGVWGAEERQMAAMKFFLYTLVGSLLMLVAIVAIYFISQPSAGGRSFDYATIYNALIGANKEISACMAQGGCDHLSPMASVLKTWAPWMFAAFALAFAIKVPMFPLHTWLPDAHVQAPVAGSMVLAGVMLKMGTFGFWRYAIPIFPFAAREARLFLAVLAVIGIVYGALMCLAQRDIKKLIAYSSVSHLGYCMLGLMAMTPEGATGSAYQMLNHGISTGALFMLFGYLYERRHTRLMAEYGGLARVMPVFSALFLVVTFTSIAVPGTNGFVGEFLVLLGTFKSKWSLWIGVVAATGVILGAGYMLWMVQRVFFGEVTQRDNQGLRDLNLRELATAIPLVVIALGMGLMPQPLLDRIAPSTNKFVARANYGVPEASVSEETVRINVRALPDQMADSVPVVAPPARLAAAAPSPAALTGTVTP